MQNLNRDRNAGQIPAAHIELYESFQRQAESSDYVFLDGALMHWPTAHILDLRSDPIAIDADHDYSDLLKEVRLYRRRLERVRPGKTNEQRLAINACAALQKAFSVADGVAAGV